MSGGAGRVSGHGGHAERGDVDRHVNVHWNVRGMFAECSLNVRGMFTDRNQPLRTTKSLISSQVGVILILFLSNYSVKLFFQIFQNRFSNINFQISISNCFKFQNISNLKISQIIIKKKKLSKLHLILSNHTHGKYARVNDYCDLKRNTVTGKVSRKGWKDIDRMLSLHGIL
jgi:hypothetical protein